MIGRTSHEMSGACGGVVAACRPPPPPLPPPPPPPPPYPPPTPPPRIGRAAGGLPLHALPEAGVRAQEWVMGARERMVHLLLSSQNRFLPAPEVLAYFRRSAEPYVGPTQFPSCREVSFDARKLDVVGIDSDEQCSRTLVPR